MMLNDCAFILELGINMNNNYSPAQLRFVVDYFS
jgi:hypothetical protein